MTRRYENLAAEKSWNRLADLAKRKYLGERESVDANWYHLAQAYRGRLVEELFRIPQKGPDGLIKVPRDYFEDFRMSYIDFALGNMEGARRIAFNTLFSSRHIDYDMLKIVTQVELIRGNDKVADKYLKILGRQRKYREWIRNVREDSDIKRGRRIVQKREPPFIHSHPIRDLLDIVESNPSDSLAMQYALAWYLLSKDGEALYGLVERHFGTGALKSLPTPVQEALIFWQDWQQELLGDDNPVTVEWCLAHGVTESTIQRFCLFREAYMEDNGLALMGFKDTFWYYCIFTEI